MNKTAETMHIPRLLVAAPASGSGKTLVTCALLEILRRRGRMPRAYKCGPDYIDPMFHRQVQGIESGNLDSFFSDADGLRRILFSQEEACAVLEGVMGIYDGLSVEDERASCHEIAGMTDTPVLLVVDASRVGRTVLSSIVGILADDEAHLIRGILLNRISPGFYAKLRPVAERELVAAGYGKVRLLGGIPTVQDVAFKSRHLGLKLPEEIDDIREKIGRFAGVIEASCDVEGILRMMEGAGGLAAAGETDVPSLSGRTGDDAGDAPVIAVARDEAFCFYYRENIELLERWGARIRYFSPIRDRALPAGTAGILLGGGYPELHLEELAGNTAMLDSIRTALHAGIPSIAECGGFMYLHRAVRDRQGRAFPLVGAVDAECADTGHPVRFGYLQLVADGEHRPSVFGGDLSGARGHEFHYYDTTYPGEDCIAEKPDTGERRRCMICDDLRMWGFPHLYYASCPGTVRGFIRAAKEAAHEKQREILCE